MIVVDSSALIAILMSEPEGLACQNLLTRQNKLLMSAGTLSEVLIVAGGHGLGDELKALIDQCAIEVIALTSDLAQRVASAYAIWGKGYHPARLNMGDCFAYALAKERGCPLLFVGNDFSQTDIESAL